MLDQRLVRENPSLIAHGLERRGIKVNLEPLQSIAQRQKDFIEQRGTLQAEGNQIGKEVGKKIQKGVNPKSIEITELRQKGNEIKKKVAFLEEEEKCKS